MLNSLVKDDIVAVSKAHPPIQHYHLRYRDLYHMEYINEDYVCVRYIYRSDLNKPEEKNRVFINLNTGETHAYQYTNNKWEEITESPTWFNGAMIDDDNFYSVHPKLKMWENILRQLDITSVVTGIIYIAKNPIVELIWGAGAENIAHYLVYTKTVPEVLFGEMNKDKRGIYQILGLNTYQLRNLDRLVARNSNKTIKMVSGIKKILNTSTLANLDKETYKDCCKTYEAFRFSSYDEPYDNISRISIPALGEGQARMRLLNRIGKLKSDEVTNPLKLFYDAIQMYQKFPLDMAPEINPRELRFPSDVRRFHDYIVELYNNSLDAIKSEDAKKRQERMKEIDVKRKKWFEYEDDEYIIRLPESENEISQEGRVLNHCVSGYCQDHATGRTTILFMREKKHPKKSFCTIEVKGQEGNFYVTQAHCQSNAWIAYHRPEAVPFFMRWLRDKKLKCEDRIYLLKAKGYGGNGEMMARPAI